MTAREQAREAVRKNMAAGEYDEQNDALADAASDVWEPVVKQLAAALRFSPYISQAKTQAAMNLAAEALGVSVIDLRDLT